MDARTTKASTLRGAASDFARELDIPRRAQAHPYGALAAAIGVGYVLGGGLFTRLTARLLKVGVRVGAELAAVPLLVKAADTLIEAKASRDEGDARSPQGIAEGSVVVGP